MKNTIANRTKRAPYMKIAITDINDNLFYRRPIAKGNDKAVKYKQKYYKISFDRQDGIYFLSERIYNISEWLT